VAGHVHGDEDQGEGRARVRAQAWPFAEKKGWLKEFVHFTWPNPRVRCLHKPCCNYMISTLLCPARWCDLRYSHHICTSRISPYVIYVPATSLLWVARLSRALEILVAAPMWHICCLSISGCQLGPFLVLLSVWNVFCICGRVEYDPIEWWLAMPSGFCQPADLRSSTRHSGHWLLLFQLSVHVGPPPRWLIALFHTRTRIPRVSPRHVGEKGLHLVIVMCRQDNLAS
jgi:hypothetical protein